MVNFLYLILFEIHVYRRYGDMKVVLPRMTRAMIPDSVTGGCQYHAVFGTMWCVVVWGGFVMRGFAETFKS